MEEKKPMVNTQTKIQVVFYREFEPGITSDRRYILRSHATIKLIRVVEFDVYGYKFMEELKVEDEIYLGTVDEDLDKVVGKLLKRIKEETQEVVKKVSGAEKLVEELKDKYGYNVEVKLEDI